MILGIGIDSINVARFKGWLHKSDAELGKIFSHAEIEYCTQTPLLSAQRFAVRFAAREAFFKAYSAMNVGKKPFLTVAKAISIAHADNQVPIICVPWNTLIDDEHIHGNTFIVHCSLTHTQTVATAFVVIEKRD